MILTKDGAVLLSDGAALTIPASQNDLDTIATGIGVATPSTPASIESAVEGLLTAANAATGEADTNLTDAVASLIAGQGGQEIYYRNGTNNSGYAISIKSFHFPYDGVMAMRGDDFVEEFDAPLYTGDFGTNFFSGCSNLRVLNAPLAEVKSHTSTFMRCTNLREVNLPNCISWGAVLQFAWDTSLEKVTLGSIGHPITKTDPTTTNQFNSVKSGLVATFYVDDDEVIPWAGQPWGAANATIVYRSATTGEVIPVE